MIRISGLPTYHRNHHFSDPTFFSLSSLFYLAGFHEVCLVLFHLFSPIFLRSGLEFPSLVFFVTFFGKEGSGGQSEISFFFLGYIDPGFKQSGLNLPAPILLCFFWKTDSFLLSQASLVFEFSLYSSSLFSESNGCLIDFICTSSWVLYTQKNNA